MAGKWSWDTSTLAWAPAIGPMEHIEVYDHEAMENSEEHKHNYDAWVADYEQDALTKYCAVCKPHNVRSIAGFALPRRKNSAEHTILMLCETCVDDDSRISAFVQEHYGVDLPIRRVSAP